MGALLVFAAVPLLPPLRVVVPIEQALLLITPALAVCALLGWWSGGRLSLALIWGLLAVWVLSLTDYTAAPHFDRLARGWALLLPASFGVVSVLAPARDFLTRALIAIVLALVAGASVIIAMGGDATELVDLVRREFIARNQEFVDAYQVQLGQSAGLRQLAEDNPMFASFAQDVPQQLQQLALASASVFPSLLALESLAALALAWSLFHRLSRTRIGDPLEALGDFRFDDQFIWGLLLGVTLLILRSLEGFESVGWMLVVFFGGLYVVRGLGVVAWWLRSRRRWTTALVLIAVLAAPIHAMAVLLGLGVGDTWVDWRRRPRSAT
jgi:hypothetical protein